jgi:glutamate/tyrosine decarboxylase-like PLP-dependent enzyme
MTDDSEPGEDETSDSLDPEDWPRLRAVAHQALDEALEFLRSVRERPAWRAVPEPVQAELAESLPVEPQDLERVYSDFRRLVLPYPLGNIHPRYFGGVTGAGLPSGIVADVMASAMNSNCGGRVHSGLYVERVVIDWCRAVFGFPSGSSGLLVTGSSMANLVGLTVARNARAGGDIRARGLQGRPKPLVLYTSTEAHHSVARAVEILGLGRDALRGVAVDADFRLDSAALRKAIADDRKAGLQPFCVVGTAGTVNTGAIDDLETLADVCRSEDLWFHVDGGFGALAVLSEARRPRLAGLDKADSLAFDFHKWMHVQYDAGCLLVRDGESHLSAFSMFTEYLHSTRRGLTGGGVWPSDLGPELSRGFRALKVWFALKQHGAAAFGRAIEKNCRQAEYLAGRIRRTPGAELMHEPSLNIVCFRFRPESWDEADIDRLNQDIVVQLQESGIAAPSTTRIGGRLAIRVNLTNHRTRREDLDLFLRAATDAASERTRPG